MTLSSPLDSTLDESLRVEPGRAEIDALPGAVMLEFGTGWCPHCQGAQPLIAAALAGHANIRHLKIEDGSGKPLGRSFQVKLWPTLIFLRDGNVVGRVVRPKNAAAIESVLTQLQP
jgi:thioredoxin 1